MNALWVAIYLALIVPVHGIRSQIVDQVSNSNHGVVLGLDKNGCNTVALLEDISQAENIWNIFLVLGMISFIESSSSCGLLALTRHCL
eukprot:Skav228868  [mRNA]  locus=scaffold816:308374:310363:+ [translate_table: standard]